VVWIYFLIGFLLGWLVEWVLDIFYWRSACRRKEAELAEGRKRSLDLQAKLDAAERGLLEQKENAKRLAEENEELRRSLTEAKKRAEALQTELDQLREQNARLGAEIQTLRGRLAELEASEEELQETKRRLAAAREEVRQTEAELEAAQKALPPDDLQVIEGIGPKIKEVLSRHGIRTFKQLAETPVERLREILAQAGERFRLADPATWPKQAKLAAERRWEELKKLQARLKGGREPKGDEA